MNIELLRQYDIWNEKKKGLQTESSSDQIYFNEADIWWCSVGLNVGREAFGKGKDFRRPILIIKKLSAELCIALPLTSKKKDGTWFVEIPIMNGINWIMLHQIRTLHRKRLQHKITRLEKEDFMRVKEKLELLLELSPNNHPAFAGIEGISPKSAISIANVCDESIEFIDCPVCVKKEAFLAEYNDFIEHIYIASRHQ